jgi:hypothetical protein
MKQNSQGLFRKTFIARFSICSRFRALCEIQEWAPAVTAALAPDEPLELPSREYVADDFLEGSGRRTPFALSEFSGDENAAVNKALERTADCGSESWVDALRLTLPPWKR